MITFFMVASWFGETNAQKLTDSLLVSFYNQTFKYYYSKIDTLNFRTYHISKDSLPKEIKTDYNNFKLSINDIQKEHNLIQKGMRGLSKVYTKEISKDTNDIVIDSYVVSYKRKLNPKITKHGFWLFSHHYFYSVSCRGSMGYIPEGRFIYSYEAKRWRFISYEEILNQKLELLKK